VTLEDERFDLPAGRAFPEEPHWKDPCVVEDKQIAWLQELAQVSHSPMQTSSSLTLVHKHSRRIPRFSWLIGDQSRREIELEIGKAQGSCHTKLQGEQVYSEPIPSALR
jgi:hypothetical protein